MRELFIFVFLLILPGAVAAQLQREEIKKHLLTSSYPIDSSSGAVVLYEHQTTNVSFERNRYIQTCTVYRTIKILRESAYKEANIKVNFRGDNYKNFIQDIHASSYNLVNGELVEEALTSKDFYKKQLSDDICQLSFSLPSIQVGTVIEYSYTTVATFHGNLPVWQVQEHLPKMVSHWEVEYPAVFKFTSVIHIGEPLSEQASVEAALGAKSNFCHIKPDGKGGGKTKTVEYVRKNIEGYKEERFVRNIHNLLEQLDMHMTGRTDKENNDGYITSWEKLNESFYKSPAFGAIVFADNDLLKGKVVQITVGATGEMEKAHRIYNYVRENFTIDHNLGGIGTKELEKVMENKGGTASEINLLLTAMLLKARLNAGPLITATTEGISLPQAFPVYERSNYVACALKIDGKHVFLDASDKSLPFGLLPLHAYNGYARIISKTGDEVELSCDSLLDESVYTLKAHFTGDSLVHVAVTKKMGLISSYELRKAWVNSTADHKKLIEADSKRLPNETIPGNISIVNEQDVDSPLLIKYELDIPTEKAGDMYFFSPNIFPIILENPLKDAKRKWPVEFLFRIKTTEYTEITLPAGWEPETPFANKELIGDALNAPDDLKFNLSIKQDGACAPGVACFTSSLVVDRVTFPANAYEALKTKFDKCISYERHMMKFRKKI